jgi:hypothetical protein
VGHVSRSDGLLRFEACRARVSQSGRVEESATKSIYKLGVGFERCEKKGEKSNPISLFIAPTITKKKKLSNQPKPTIHPIQSQPSNIRDMLRNKCLSLERKLLFAYFCGRAGHLDEFCFRRKRIEKRCFDYARNSYRDVFSNFSPHSFSRALPRTPSRALTYFSHGPNHGSYGFGS